MAVNATAVWRVRPSGNNANGGGYDSGIAGAATDYSQQNAAQATGTNGATSGAGSTTFTDSTASAFTAAMVGNCIQIASGTNFQAGFYFVITFTDANNVVLDRTPSSGAAGSGGVWKLGGGWADMWTNQSPLVPGNTVYILGSGTPNPAAYVYDYSPANSSRTFTAGSTTGKITYANDPNTPGYKAPPDTTGGMPTIRVNTSGGSWITTGDYLRWQGIWFVGNSNNLILFDHISYHLHEGCVFDQAAQYGGYGILFSSAIMGCEMFSATGSPLSGGNTILDARTSLVYGCNIHDNWGIPISCISGQTVVDSCIIAKSGDNGISITVDDVSVINCTIDGNAGSGIVMSGGAARIRILNNIISNHTTAGKFGLSFGTNTAAQNNAAQLFVDYNVYYNNNTDTNNIGYGAHDTHGGSNPYVAGAENYTLA